VSEELTEGATSPSPTRFLLTLKVFCRNSSSLSTPDDLATQASLVDKGSSFRKSTSYFGKANRSRSWCEPCRRAYTGGERTLRAERNMSRLRILLDCYRLQRYQLMVDREHGDETDGGAANVTWHSPPPRSHLPALSCRSHACVDQLSSFECIGTSRSYTCWTMHCMKLVFELFSLLWLTKPQNHIGLVSRLRDFPKNLPIAIFYSTYFFSFYAPGFQTSFRTYA
jgi:hypothetical protein